MTTSGPPLRLKVGWQLPDIVPRLSITASLGHSSGLNVSITTPLAITGTAATMATTKHSPVRIYTNSLSRSPTIWGWNGGDRWINAWLNETNFWIRFCECVYACCGLKVMLYNIVFLKIMGLDLDNSPVQCRFAVQAVRQKVKHFYKHICSIFFFCTFLLFWNIISISI